MKVEVKITKNFKKEAKSLLKKYPSLIDELEILQNELVLKPQSGSPLGSQCFKIRLAIKSKGKGKSGGARIISFVETEVVKFIQITETTTFVNLISIYDKSEVDSIDEKELKDLIKKRNL
jgi:mRNA-degrading endonuclease RelE of RelBE toxin-antitoxin system